MARNAIMSEFGAVVIDVTDLVVMGTFWGELLGEQPGPVRGGGDWLTVGSLEGAVWLTLQRVPEPKRVKNRVHLDFRVDDVDKAISRIVELGGKQLSAPRVGGGVTMSDPEGNEFCIGAFQRNREGRRVSSS